MQKLFSQELRFNDDQGHPFPDWQVKRLGEVVEIVGGGTPSSDVPAYWDGEIQWFTPTEIKQKYLSKSHRTISRDGLKHSSAKILPKGTVLLSTRATIGDAGIALGECCTNQGFQNLVANGGIDNEFLYYSILTLKKEFLRRASGSTFQEIGKSELEKLTIPLPTFPEQQKIANLLCTLDRQIALLEPQPQP